MIRWRHWYFIVYNRPYISADFRHIDFCFFIFAADYAISAFTPFGHAILPRYDAATPTLSCRHAADAIYFRRHALRQPFSPALMTERLADIFE